MTLAKFLALLSNAPQATLRDLLQAFLPSAPLFIALVCR